MAEMRTSFLIALAGIFLFAQTGDGQAQQAKPDAKNKGKQKRCFTKAEHAGEGELRYGIRLREYAWICDARPFSAETWETWTAIDEANKDRFIKLTEDRKKAFEREFPDNHKALLAAWDGRIVMHYRYHPMNAVMCDDLSEQLDDIKAKGWKEFQKLAKKNKPEVMLDYKVCPGK
jgi:hypothetical protein